MRAVLLILILTISGGVYSQEAGDTVQMSSFNEGFLDSLIFQEVNEVRKDNDLAKLFFSDTLDIESKQHASFMVQQRSVEYSSSQSKAGECNLKIYVHAGRITYKTLSQSIVKRWLDSPGHTKLILGEFFLYGGCGVSSMEWKSIDEMYVYVCFRISYWP